MSNVLGTVPDVKTAIDMAHAVGADVLLDGCQAAVNLVVDVRALDADFYVGTGHKIYGPTGIGFLYGKKAKLEAMPPFEGGGEMIETVSRDVVTYNSAPHRFEAGTPPIVEAIGLGAAITWLAKQDRDAIHLHKQALLAQAVDALRGINGLSPAWNRPRQGAGSGVLAAGGASARSGPDPGQVWRGDSRRASLRPAADDPSRGERNRPGELCPL